MIPPLSQWGLSSVCISRARNATIGVKVRRTRFAQNYFVLLYTIEQVTFVHGKERYFYH